MNKCKGHKEAVSKDLFSSPVNTVSTKGNVEHFAVNTMQSRKSVSPTPERRSYIYSANLSSTSSPDITAKVMVSFPFVNNRSSVMCVT